MDYSRKSLLRVIGGETRQRSWSVLRKNGTMVAIAMPPPDEAQAREHQVKAAMVTVVPDGARLATIGTLIDAGELTVVIDREFPLPEAAAAHSYSQHGHARGKIILRVGENQ